MWVFEGRGDDVFFQERYFGYDLGPSSHPRWVSGAEPNPGSNTRAKAIRPIPPACLSRQRKKAPISGAFPFYLRFFY